MSSKTPDGFSRRERQILDILFAQGQATVQEVLHALPDPPTYSAVRGLLRVMELKGQIRHVQDGVRYVYLPTQPLASAGKNALQQALQTFFGGSVERAVATLLSSSDSNLSDEELTRLSDLIQAAKTEKQESPDA